MGRSALLTKGEAVSVSSAATPSISPSVNKLILAAVGCSRGGTSNVPTLSGAGVTWVLVGTIVNGNEKLHLFRALSLTTPAGGAVTIDFAGQTQSIIEYMISEVDNVDLSGTNGSGAVVQFTSSSGTSIDGANINASLSAFSNPNNATFGAVYINATIGITHGLNFSEIGYNVANHAMESEFADNPQTNVDWTHTGFIGYQIVAIEIKQNAFGGGFIY